ncbi:UDP-4-amino-4,6-dideoxy-N-acetyl-beta-L-altrosamine N-acetyltransferase [uncultured Tissierella sp.]|uniref:UDP-4-amino-4, 6-dideoxy-N-acetyl-beta-L-altrosamine N-acetyltransferase n=1 Tax=uncultured Tissierella sp. TaxID=448160 RepID=UPI002805A643|nr:UDP-4-amino-4,6-dideoxy-N-acetyl-beta-L-altrosamine N-acetyltransferase [uncultured Tissierella sp.]MDU5079762.1 UDP-4-amino-4,6-dideoxy-N-acetyl-beta-L-altrosamine N-acetyltransferase [Bacillota bacterium]
MSLELVKIAKDDLEQIMHWRMKPEVTKYMYTDPVLTLEIQEKWFDSIKNDTSVKYWMIKIDGVKIGVINLRDIDYINRRCTWGYYIGDNSFRGRGIASTLECNIYDYVFNILNLNKFWCEVFSFNEKVISIHERFGSIIEGTLKQHIYKNGEFFDIVMMAITKDRWEEIKDNYSYEKIYIEE